MLSRPVRRLCSTSGQSFERVPLCLQHGEYKAELREVQAALQYSNVERERLAIETAEQKDNILAKHAECAKLEMSLKEMSCALATANATLTSVNSQVESNLRRSMLGSDLSTTSMTVGGEAFKLEA